MRILHLLSQHPESTGSGVYLQNILQQAKNAGHQNFLVAGISPSTSTSLAQIPNENCLFVRFETEDLHFKIPGMSDVMPYPSSTFTSLEQEEIETYIKNWSTVISKAVIRFQPEVIHSHHLWIMTGITRKLFPDIPMVTSCHSTDLRQFQQCDHLQEFVYRNCTGIDRILALSHSQKSDIRKIFPTPEESIDIVGGGIDRDKFQFYEKNSPPPVEILYAGKLSMAKGVDLLLQTTKESKTHDFHLHLAGSGSGPEKDECLRLAAELGNRVTLHGQLDQQQLANLMGSCHIFILPSFYEGLPLVLLEALASGCRIITTNLPGSMELLSNASHDLVRFIELPELKTIDRPKEKDVRDLKNQIDIAIKKMAEEVRTNPTPPSQEINKLIDPYCWPTVFGKIESSYYRAFAK